MKAFITRALGLGLVALSPELACAQETTLVRSGVGLVREPVLYFGTGGAGPALVLIHGQENAKEPSLAKELTRRGGLDQECRNALIRFTVEHKLVEPVDISKLDSAVATAYKSLQAKMMDVDRDNLTWIKTVVAKHGWPGKTRVGKNAALQALLIVQHAVGDIEFQEACLKKMEASPKGEVEPQHMAYLTDRILVMRGKKQKYGTQATWVNGKIVASPIEDEATVDERRKALGLEPMSLYLKRMEALYKNPEELKSDRSESK